MSTPRVLVLAATATVIAAFHVVPAAAMRETCTPVAPRDWAAATTVQPGAGPLVVSAHRGGVNLAPQQTWEAYKAAMAYGVDNIEVDLRLSEDGQFVVAHDTDPRSVNASGVEERHAVSQLTAAEYTAQNAAVGSWKGTEFDPARYLTFDQALGLAAAHHTGLDIEFKDIGSRRDRIREVAAAVEVAGIMDRTIWQHGLETDVVAYVRSVNPGARFNYNIGEEPPAFLYQQAASTDFSFGSSFAEFTPDRIAAIHDGCGLVLPHSYDGLDDGNASREETAKEHAAMVDGLARGMDGFQTNRPDAAADALDRPVPAALVRSANGVCLVNPGGTASSADDLPLPGRTIVVANRPSVTGKGGCVSVRGARWARFDGDGSARPAKELRGS